MVYFSLTAGGDSASWSTKANDTTVAYINVCRAVGEAHGCNPTAGVCLKKVGDDSTDVRNHYTVHMQSVIRFLDWGTSGLGSKFICLHYSVITG